LSVNRATPTAGDFNISGLGIFTYDGSVRTVTVTAKSGKSNGTVTVQYNSSTTAPSAAGTYIVTFNVAEATNWNAATSLNAGTLTISSASFTTAPTLTLTAGDGSLSYSWTASNPAADSYDIYWKAGDWEGSAADVKTGTKITGATSGGSISGLTNGVWYSLLVTANKAGYTSIDSTVKLKSPYPVELKVFETAPTLDLRAGSESIYPYWQAPYPSADSFDVYWKAGANLSAAEVKTGTKITDPPRGEGITGLTNGTAYSVVVTANKAGYASIDSTVKTVTPSQLANSEFFNKPTGFTLTAGNGSLKYSWLDSVPKADSYDVWWKAGSNLYEIDIRNGGTKITGATSGGSISGLTNGTAYSVVVFANKAGFQASYSDVRTGTPYVTSVVNAVQPVISVQPQSGTFFKSGILSVTASVTDGGNLTYQWYRNTTNSTSGGTAISGATNSSYTVSATGYYYVIVTNTITNNGDSGTKTATTTSNVANVIIETLVAAEWARTVSSGSSNSWFYDVTVDSSGNVYAAGFQYGSGTYTYGAGVSAQGGAPRLANGVLVKYNSSGTAQWARTVSAGSNGSGFTAVAVDSSGNVYAAGTQDGTGTYTYGAGVSAQGTNSYSGVNAGNVVLVKYNSSGTAQWARTVSAGSNGSYFFAVTVDSSGIVYAAGEQDGTGNYTYGDGVSAQGTSSRQNVVLVKYNSSGTAQWAQTISAGSNGSFFLGVAVDSSGNVYAAGDQDGTGTYTYGDGVSAQGISNQNVVLVKYKQQ
jgi:hypothetical protein